MTGGVIWSRSPSFVTPAWEVLRPGTRHTPVDPSGNLRPQSRSAVVLLTPGPGPCPPGLVKPEPRDQRRRSQPQQQDPNQYPRSVPWP